MSDFEFDETDSADAGFYESCIFYLQRGRAM
jgi:hypothetical protein